MMSDKQCIAYEQIESAALSMLSKGVTPSIRSVMAVTGGKTETVAKFLRDFNEKRSAEVIKMVDEIGSSDLAKLLATEMLLVIDRRTRQLQTEIAELKAQRDETIELLSEQELACRNRAELAETKAAQAIAEANEKISQANDRTTKAERDLSDCLKKAEQIQVTATDTIKAANEKCELLVNNAKQEAASLVDAANNRADKAEKETAVLREQVKTLSVEQAKREIEQAQYLQTLEAHKETVTALADERTQNVRLQTKQESLLVENNRLLDELADARVSVKQLGTLQGQTIEMQKQCTQLQHDLTQSERERESLMLALRTKNLITKE